MTPREHLIAAKTTLHKEANGILSLLAKAATCAEEAIVAFQAGRHAEAKLALDQGCDAEYEALGDCEALGMLSEALYPDEAP